MGNDQNVAVDCLWNAIQKTISEDTLLMGMPERVQLEVLVEVVERLSVQFTERFVELEDDDEEGEENKTKVYILDSWTKEDEADACRS